MRISAISAIKQNTKKTNSIVRIYFASFGINTEHLFYKSRLVDISTCCVTEFEIHSPLSAVFAYFCINFIYQLRNFRATQHTTCAETFNNTILCSFKGWLVHFTIFQIIRWSHIWHFKSRCLHHITW